MLHFNDLRFRYWSGLALNGGTQSNSESPSFYIGVYAAITGAGLIVSTLRYFVLYNGSIRASTVLYKQLLETVLFADIRFHDTVLRGWLLNRFGKDFEGGFISSLFQLFLVYSLVGIDSRLSDNFGRTIMYGLSVLTTLVMLSVVGGLPFILALSVLGVLYYNGKSIPTTFITIVLVPTSTYSCKSKFGN